MPASAAGTVIRGGDALVAWGAVGNVLLGAGNSIFAGKFNVKDGGAEVNVSTFDDGRSGNYFTVDDCHVTISWPTWFPAKNIFDPPYSVQKNAEFRVHVYPVKTDATTFWLFTNLKVLNINHDGESGREGLQPVSVEAFARVGYFYPATGNNTIGPASDG